MFVALSGVLAEVQKPLAICVCCAGFVIYDIFCTSEEVYYLHHFCQSAKTFFMVINNLYLKFVLLPEAILALASLKN